MMDRRKFLKNLSIGTASVTTGATIGAEVIEFLSEAPPTQFTDKNYLGGYYWYDYNKIEAQRKFEDMLEMQILGGSSFQSPAEDYHKPENDYKPDIRWVSVERLAEYYN